MHSVAASCRITFDIDQCTLRNDSKFRDCEELGAAEMGTYCPGKCSAPKAAADGPAVEKMLVSEMHARACAHN
jgi:hypothetical protein